MGRVSTGPFARTPTEGWALLQVCSPSNTEGPDPANRHNAPRRDGGGKPKVRTVVDDRDADGSATATAAVRLSRVLKIGGVQ